MTSPLRALVFILMVGLLTPPSLSAADASNDGSSAKPPNPELVADGAPLIDTWEPAEFPASLDQTVTRGKALVRVVVDATGKVTAARVLRASKDAFGDAAVSTVKQWKFTPGVDNGKRVTMSVDVPFEFNRDHKPKKSLLPPENLLPRLSPHTGASLDDGPLAEYPESLIGRGLPGRITFRCRVSADGTASDLRIINASHADLVLPALQSAPNWHFKAALQGDLPVASELAGEVTYRDSRPPPREKVLAANGISAPDGSEPEHAPQMLEVADPVWPYDLLIAGKGGSATVEFTVGGNGSVRDVHVRDATDPEVGASLVAAVESSGFEPAVVHGVGTDVTLVKRFEFTAVATEPAKDAPEWLARLVPLARAGAIEGGKGLDEKLTPLYRVAPNHPESIPEDEKGQATIEFVIDRDGRARLPRIVSATKPEFGWAAATAISQWVFKAPRRAGQPTAVKVQIPMAF